ncbi:3-phosphoshikimate 1-carboxyvinyltransferase [Mobilisporobacter senegalensis]|uniref:3-phosphoshikimate 1-carboxyvinyltransferase n=1 Tax=Mobilisporobacter senegalensis TaxID=1329262 RepID=A0A3N1XLV1_9FIRM|nr:3-phosphoshikimate 1-carboxyvinyltransferase [Mobilisporobacter senegalensis]ROR27148.1 3-phosphoshikimate 1-carboxyvinyltransferase [Mobilisporobacter senegalensis]
MIFHKIHSLKGEVTVPGDKSISHRAIMLGSLAQGTTEITNFLQGEDCLSTIRCFGQMGIHIENNKDTILVHGKGLHGLRKPDEILDVGNSGTTTRLISGILSATDFEVTLTGDSSIQKRPMGRIITPLTMMGAKIESIKGNGCAPLFITGSKLKGIHYISEVASAQVKSGILLAGLYADGETSITEPYVSRNHTELMFQYFGIDIQTDNTTVTVQPAKEFPASQVVVPGDISSAAYFIVAGLIVPNSEIRIKNVGINPTRDGIIKVCEQMGANITLENITDTNGEPTADIIVRSSELTGTIIEGGIIPTLIDELPIIAILAAVAKGQTVIKDASELKVKESNRIDVMVKNLKLMGVDVEGTEDGMIINGGNTLHGATIDSKLDHRIAMSFAIAALLADGPIEILGAECVNISYPDFYTHLNDLSQ